MRISIIGMPGSGKSTLAEAISKKLSIPHIQLDRFWFESGGRTGEHDTLNIVDVRAKVKARTMEAISSDSWVSDGFFFRIQPLISDRADVVIFLDIPLWKRLVGHFRRMMRPDSRHKELSTWDDLKFFIEIVRRDFTKKSRLKEFAKSISNKIITFRSWKDADGYLDAL